MISYQLWEHSRRQWLIALAECIRDQRDFWPFYYPDLMGFPA